MEVGPGVVLEPIPVVGVVLAEEILEWGPLWSPVQIWGVMCLVEVCPRRRTEEEGGGSLPPVISVTSSSS